jgi:hypothetical protein
VVPIVPIPGRLVSWSNKRDHQKIGSRRKRRTPAAERTILAEKPADCLAASVYPRRPQRKLGFMCLTGDNRQTWEKTNRPGSGQIPRGLSRLRWIRGTDDKKAKVSAAETRGGLASLFLAQIGVRQWITV